MKTKAKIAKKRKQIKRAKAHLAHDTLAIRTNGTFYGSNSYK